MLEGMSDRMWSSQLWMLLLAYLVSSLCLFASGFRVEGKDGALKTAVFVSPPFYLKPGSVENRHYYNIPFPRGHIAVKSFSGEVIDEKGNPVSLHEAYLHHWGAFRYYDEEGAIDESRDSKIILVRNSGPCSNIGPYYGFGSETRKTDSWVPDPYGIEAGNPTETPQGYEERWMLSVHAIDMRGVEDRLGCTECRCNLYNATVDVGYVGGLHCCYDKTQCRLQQGFSGRVRKLFFRYTVKWVEWNPTIVLPVKIYVFDVTDTGGDRRPSTLLSAAAVDACKIEYTVPACDDSAGEAGNGQSCVDVRKTNVLLPHGGDIIYGVAHQHAGGLGAALYGEDGRLLCSSNPLYGKGEEAGDEAGYIVGMSTCYPNSATAAANIKDGEVVTLISNYSSVRMHTGVMGLFYILVAEPQPKLNAFFSLGVASSHWFIELVETWWMIGGIMAAVAAIIFLIKRHGAGGGYEIV